MEQETLASRKRWAGRLAAVFYLASGVLSLATLPLSSTDADLAGLAAVSVLRCRRRDRPGCVDWGRRSRRASLVLVPPGLFLIAAGNAYGGSGYFTYGVFFLLVFVWIGFAHEPGMSSSSPCRRRRRTSCRCSPCRRPTSRRASGLRSSCSPCPSSWAKRCHAERSAP